jgi:hypothetical protein
MQAEAPARLHARIRNVPASFDINPQFSIVPLTIKWLNSPKVSHHASPL